MNKQALLYNMAVATMMKEAAGFKGYGDLQDGDSGQLAKNRDIAFVKSKMTPQNIGASLRSSPFLDTSMHEITKGLGHQLAGFSGVKVPPPSYSPESHDMSFDASPATRIGEAAEGRQNWAKDLIHTSREGGDLGRQSKRYLKALDNPRYGPSDASSFGGGEDWLRALQDAKAHR